MIRRTVSWSMAVVLLAGCDAAEDVRVQPLPSLEASSPEARAGLPEIAGSWRFAGWELAPGDTGRVESDLPGFGELRLETQRLDSIAGSYIAPGGRMPLVGEVRRDGMVALAGGGRYLTGRYERDTLWLALTSLVEPAAWPSAARAAFVRSPVASRFVRVKGAVPALAAADTAAMDSAVAAPVPGEAIARPGAPVTARPSAPVTAPPSRTGEATPRVAEPTPATPAAPQEEEPEPEPEPEPSPPPRRSPPRLLGVPVDSTGYSPTAARAIERPTPVSASR